MKSKIELFAMLTTIDNDYSKYDNYLNCSEEANDCLLKMYSYLLEDDTNMKEKRWNLQIISIN